MNPKTKQVLDQRRGEDVGGHKRITITDMDTGKVDLSVDDVNALLLSSHSVSDPAEQFRGTAFFSCCLPTIIGTINSVHDTIDSVELDGFPVGLNAARMLADLLGIGDDEGEEEDEEEDMKKDPDVAELKSMAEQTEQILNRLAKLQKKIS